MGKVTEGVKWSSSLKYTIKCSPYPLIFKVGSELRSR